MNKLLKLSLFLLVCLITASLASKNVFSENMKEVKEAQGKQQGLLPEFQFKKKTIPAQVIKLLVEQRITYPSVIDTVNLEKALSSDKCNGKVIVKNNSVHIPVSAEGGFSYKFLGQLKKNPNYYVLRIINHTGGSGIWTRVVVIKAFMKKRKFVNAEWEVVNKEFLCLENSFCFCIADRFFGDVIFDSQTSKIKIKGKVHMRGEIDKTIDLKELIKED